LLCGVDDLIFESLVLGCVGWVSGLVNAFPEESVRLYDLVTAARHKEALPLYRWFMPLLHLDIGHKLVQQIKLAQHMAGLGSELVRAPRLVLEGAEREHVRAIGQRALDQRPRLAASARGPTLSRPPGKRTRSRSLTDGVPSTAKRERARVRVRRQTARRP